ncbi:MAG: GNAT family N-acetyltransferase [Firmicutes bacterium]|nr:GNAT family N-acetyltransferase [Bacillota bacterium]
MARIYGEDIILREYREDDLKYMRKWVNNPQITKWLSDAFLTPHTYQTTEKYLKHILDYTGKEQIYFVIANKDTGEYIGQLDLIRIDWKNRVGELGIVIGTENNRGKGYGTKAIKLLQKYVFESLNLNRLELELRGYNKRAYKCYKKCGFIEEGRKRKEFYIDGEFTDTIIMSILKEEYKK